jgi:hypothetical protein
MAEQIPGTLFVLLVALAAYMLDDCRPILILALGCATGWQTFNTGLSTSVRNALMLISVGLWAAAFLFLLTKVL